MESLTRTPMKVAKRPITFKRFRDQDFYVSLHNHYSYFVNPFASSSRGLGLNSNVPPNTMPLLAV